MPEVGTFTDVQKRLRAVRKAGGEPIVVQEHSLQHQSRTDGGTQSTARITITVNGETYSEVDVHGRGPIHALDGAFRGALGQCFGAERMRCVQASGFDLHSREENPHVEAGMGVKAEVVIGFITAVDMAGRLVPVSEGDPIAAWRDNRKTTGSWRRWCARAHSEDSIRASIKALSDGYNYFAVEFLGQGPSGSIALA